MKIQRIRKTLSFLFLLGLFACFYACKGDGKTKQAHKYTNALIEETSPYLLQHAHNPVNWRAWSPEALDEAQEKDKLVLVSIGYSSCHWCHVMEEETFEDEEVARTMNENFISIKVDREERPDVDQVYMTALQLLKGHGGWPLNVITLPNGKPIYGGTYHTKDEWIQVLKEISQLYKENPERANDYANRVAQGIEAVNLITPIEGNKILSMDLLDDAISNWKLAWDLEWGGNQGQQKFMLPANLSFLLDFAALSGDETAMDFVKTTLDKMLLGGVYDQLGDGFYRYSTDPYWKVPHFEKMLYDNAQLMGLYSKAYKIFKTPAYEETVRGIANFLEREMSNGQGGYYAAMNADSEGEEGKYYIWQEEELKNSLGAEFDLFASYFNVVPENAWEDEKYVLHRTHNDSAFAKAHNLNRAALKDHKQRWKKVLLERRFLREKPSIDDKIITSWNALLIQGFAEAYEAFGDKKYLQHAIEIDEFLNTHNRDEKGLVHSYKPESRRINGFLEDYAHLAGASLRLYELTMQESYLKDAVDLIDIAEQRFADDTSGMFRFNEDQELIATIIKTDDGVIPSPNAVMAHNLYTLGHIFYKKESLNKAERMLSAMVPNMKQSPDTYAHWSALLLNTLYPYYEVAIAGTQAEAMLKDLNRQHLPNTLILATSKESDLPLFKNRFVNDATYIYVCQNHTCKLPVTSVAEAIGQLVW